MADRIRLDKYLAESGTGSRTDVKKMIRAGRVFVNKEPARQCDRKIDPDTDEIQADGRWIRRQEKPVLMLNKPSGVVSATTDLRDRTVLDLIQEPWAKAYFPVGRLDKDTEGLLFLTEDGKLSHELLSPKKHVKKTYFAVISGEPDPELTDRFREGVGIGEKRKTLPARLSFLPEDRIRQGGVPSVGSSDLEHCCKGACCVLVTITEGRFHQIKRMFQAVGRKVIYLKRISMGGIVLDESLQPGQYRPLTQKEEEQLRGCKAGSWQEETTDN